jgi:hypothetical protein
MSRWRGGQMGREGTVFGGIFLVILLVPLVLFIGSTLIIGEIERNSEIDIDEIQGMEDLNKINGIKNAIHLRIILGVLDTFSKVFTGETIMEKLYRIRETSFNIILVELGLIVLGLIGYYVYTEY